jgi:hypothetical protein
MLRKILLPGLVAGMLAAVAALIYQKIYITALGPDFSSVISAGGIFTASIAGTLLASLGYFLLDKWLKGRAVFVFNLVFVVLSFVSIIGPISVSLPLELEAPELFPGLTVPMHFFPVLAWFLVSPLFYPAYRRTAA